MQPKERLLAALSGREIDRLPWSPFLAYYWEDQPAAVQKRGQLAFLQELGADPLLRGSHVLHHVQENGFTIRTEQSGNERLTVYETPVGNLRLRHVYSPAGNTWFLVEHPVRSIEDFRLLGWIFEHLSVTPNLGEFETDARRFGQDALCVPVIGADCKTCFQSMVERWVGTVELAYAVADFPKVVEETLQSMLNVSLQTVDIAMQSSAEAFIFWEDSSTTNISPAMFERYVAPEINAWGRRIHADGRYLIHHACGHLHDLIPLMAKTEIDMIESISPPPTGNIELWQARAILPDHIGLCGGIEPTVFLNSSIDDLEIYVNDLIKRMGNNRFILANSDSCPPGVAIEKFKRVTRLVQGGSGGPSA